MNPATRDKPPPLRCASRLNRDDERPLLSGSAFLQRVLLDVSNRAGDANVVTQEYHPLARGPRLRCSALSVAMVRQWVSSRLVQGSCGSDAELRGELLAGQSVTRQHNVHVLGHDRTCIHLHCASTSVVSKPSRNRLDHVLIERDRRVVQCPLGFSPRGRIVSCRRDRFTGTRLRRRSEAAQLPCSHYLRPRTTRIVGQPEAVGAEDQVIGTNHNRMITV
jgi:hypothetical protein